MRAAFWTNSGMAVGKLIYRRWKIIYTVREETVIVGRVWPAALGEADLTTPLISLANFNYSAKFARKVLENSAELANNFMTRA